MQYKKATKAKDDELWVRLNDVRGFKKAMLTLDWARSLKSKHRRWLKKCSSPTGRGKYIVGTNNLFEAAGLYVAFHEIGHLIYHAGRTDLLAALGKPYAERNEEERKLIYDAEVEADQFAFDCLRVSTDQEDVRFLKHLGAVVAQFSSFFLLDVPDVRGFSHPDMDTRLRAVIRQVDLKEEYHQIHFKAHCSAGLQLFMALTGIPLVPDDPNEADFAQWEDLEEYIFRKIAEIKERAKQYYGQ
jgi:hypothetical protein